MTHTPPDTSATPKIEYYFSIGSPWAYIGLAPFTALAAQHGVEVQAFPISLIEENGGIYVRNRPEARRAYWLKDLHRWAAHRGKVLNMNRNGLADPTPAALLVIAAQQQGLDGLALARALQEAFWERAENIGDLAISAAIADRLGLPGATLAAQAGSASVEAQWQANYERARAAGVFGVPSFLYQGTLYWGQDSLPFLGHHLRTGQPLA
ncbi:2-hydroxychromene-2-carboxylate isomerase [Xanthobacter sp. TB0136]|uniref:2-hydroxychromene-2-carboxylate isomerase n=1 Tax=Xanthobacter sp. TB0136 TaxID=3459177 RepID=UPI0040398371